MLADKIVEYNRLCPEVKIELISDVSPKIIELMKTDRCDVGFLNLPIAPDEGIVITDSIALLHDVFVAGGEFFPERAGTLSVWDLQKYPLLLMEQNTVARAALDRHAESLGAKLLPAVEIDSWGFMKRLVERGMGIGCIPREYSLNELESGSLVELRVEPAMPARSVAVALPRAAATNFSLRSFLNLFRQ